jgi:hypothetical protein
MINKQKYAILLSQIFFLIRYLTRFDRDQGTEISRDWTKVWEEPFFGMKTDNQFAVIQSKVKMRSDELQNSPQGWNSQN